MSKRNREKRTFNVQNAVTHTLLKDFQCTNEQIELVLHGLNREVPSDVLEHMQKALAGKYELPERGFILDYEDGTEPEHLTLTNHPLNCLHHYLTQTYGLNFGHIYWAAITTPDMRKFLEFIPMLKRLISHDEV